MERTFTFMDGWFIIYGRILHNLWKDVSNLWTDASNLWTDASNLWTDAPSLWTGASNLWTEASNLRNVYIIRNLVKYQSNLH